MKAMRTIFSNKFIHFRGCKSIYSFQSYSVNTRLLLRRMAKPFFFVCIMAALTGCMNTAMDPWDMLANAVDATLKAEETYYRGHAEVAVADQIIYREEASLPDTLPSTSSFADTSAAPISKALYIPLVELQEAARNVTVDREARSNGATVLLVEIEPSAAKQGIERYFHSRMEQIREQYNMDGQAGQVSQVIQEEEARWDEMLKSLSAETEYKVFIDPQTNVIIKLDAGSRLRYNMEGRTMQETVRGTYNRMSPGSE